MPRAKTRREEPAEAESDIAMEEAPTSHQPEAEEDDMEVDQDDNDEAGAADEEEAEEEEEEEEVQRVRLVCVFLISNWECSGLTHTHDTSSPAQHPPPPHSSFSMRPTPSGTRSGTLS